MENSKDFFSNFDLINAYELKGRFCQKRRFYCDCLSINCSHFLTVWATDPRLVPNERYFDVVLGEKRRQRYFQRVIPPNINDIVVSGNFFAELTFSWPNALETQNKSVYWVFTKKYFKISFIWDQSGICSSNRLEMRAI